MNRIRKQTQIWKKRKDEKTNLNYCFSFVERQKKNQKKNKTTTTPPQKNHHTHKQNIIPKIQQKNALTPHPPKRGKNNSL